MLHARIALARLALRVSAGWIPSVDSRAPRSRPRHAHLPVRHAVRITAMTLTATHPDGHDPHGDFLPGPGEPGLVSVVIPAYNRERLIGAAIDSVLAQTYREVEVIVVDDGSKDRTCEVVERYGAPVRLVRQANGGAAAARNTGFRHARGEFVALLDSDDVWHPWKLEAQVRLLRARPRVGMVWTNMTSINEQGDVLQHEYLRTFYSAFELAKIEEVCTRTEGITDVWPEAPAEVAHAPVYEGDIFSRILLGNLVHTSTLLVRRSRLRETGEIDVAFTPRGEDYEFHVRICSHGPVALIDAPSILYRIGGADQLTAPHFYVHSARSNLAIVERWISRARHRITLPQEVIVDRLAQSHRWAGETEVFAGHRGRARRHLWNSLRLRPTQSRVLVLLLFSMLPRVATGGAIALKALLRRMGILTGAWMSLPEAFEAVAEAGWLRLELDRVLGAACEVATLIGPAATTLA
jgi:glycosyltransferase involved in cell wall biosynthesis